MSQDYEDDLLEGTADDSKYTACVDVTSFSLPEGFHLK